MSILRQYNCEFFTPKFAYRDSFQTGSIEYAFDYTDIEKCKLEGPLSLSAQVGDYVRIKSGETTYLGVVSDIGTDKNVLEIEYKPLSKIFDVDVYTPTVSGTVETILSGLISAEYVSNSDTLQNITGLTVRTTSSTSGAFGLNEGVNNLYNMVLEAFTSYGIVCSFSLDPQNKKLVLTIGTIVDKPFVIESDLNSVLLRNIVIKESKEFVNKVTIYDSADYTRSIIYYMQPNGTISTTPSQRITPVKETSLTVDVKTNSDGTDNWSDKALAKATSTLKAPQYKNLIEITTAVDDMLVRPSERFIGQSVSVISGEHMYSSVLTGYEIKDGEYTLVFGIYREELSKILKKRWRTNNGD